MRISFITILAYHLVLMSCNEATFSSSNDAKNGDDDHSSGNDVPANNSSIDAVPDPSNPNSNPNGNPNPTTAINFPTTSEDVTAVCQKLTKQNFRKTLDFPANPGQQCPFGSGDNLFMSNGTITARGEQKQSITLPQRAVICSMELSSPAQPMRYDDFLLLVLDNTLICSSTARLANAFSKQGDLVVYDWSRIRGHSTGGLAADGHYCLGQNSPGSTSQMPPSDTNGQFLIRLGPEPTAKISVLLSKQATHDFRLIVTGDDNIGSDCQHLAINLNLSIDYVIIP